MNSIHFITGSEPMPDLPEGWTVERYPGSVACVFSPDRRRYLASERGLYPMVRLAKSAYPLEIDERGFIPYADLK